MVAKVLEKKDYEALLDAAEKCIKDDQKTLLKYGTHHQGCLHLDQAGKAKCVCGLASEYRRINTMVELLGK